MAGFPILSVITFLPLVGALCILPIRDASTGQDGDACRFFKRPNEFIG